MALSEDLPLHCIRGTLHVTTLRVSVVNGLCTRREASVIDDVRVCLRYYLPQCESGLGVRPRSRTLDGCGRVGPGADGLAVICSKIRKRAPVADPRVPALA